MEMYGILIDLVTSTLYYVHIENVCMSAPSGQLCVICQNDKWSSDSSEVKYGKYLVSMTPYLSEKINLSVKSGGGSIMLGGGFSSAETGNWFWDNGKIYLVWA